MFCGAVLVLYRGLRAIEVPEIAAVLAASGVLWADPVLEGRYAHVLPDLLALGFAVAAIGAVLMLVARDGWRERTLLAVLVAATYHLRPAYLFLVPLVPLLAWVVPKIVGNATRVRIAAVLVVAPFLAYCTARYAAFGQFNLVSFGGVNAIGIAGQLLEEKHLPELSAETQPLARAILERRATVANDKLMVAKWVSPVDEVSVSRSLLGHQFNFMIWAVATPVSNDNALLAKLSREVFALEPKSWAARPAAARDVRVDGSTLRPIVILAALGVGFFLAKTLLVVLVEPAFTRYVFPATVFLPPLLVVAAASLSSLKTPARS